MNSPVLSLAWDPRRRGALVFGCEDGVAGFINDFKSKAGSQKILFGTEAPVYCLAFDASHGTLAAGVGPEVHIARDISHERYATYNLLPKPGKFNEERSDNRIRPRCWDVDSHARLWQIEPEHDHGYIARVPPVNSGFSALSPNCRTLLLSNLSGAIELYPLGQSKLKQSFKYVSDATRNVPLEVAFTHNGQVVLSGAPRGNVPLWETKTGDLIQTLTHEDDLIQIICAKQYRTTGYIAAAAAEKSESTYIRIWKAQLTSDARESLLDSLTSTWKFYIYANVEENVRELQFYILGGIALIVATYAFYRDSTSMEVKLQLLRMTTVAFFKYLMEFISVLWAYTKELLRSGLREFLELEVAHE
ncbi:hypothetical protein SERLADRAFT_404466 [Serpula lacrymans var. lacrymans S7.9]|uniref:Anaphase-promoting complex subunit 4 WD40 domain-containing protein n=1 Tax=Serpula lacrymans var. lacrymans (strain S7.9) TaxID=578457 RepID=F8ND89_SERL9|nr:uncharacterized protein SERLADRAFT_404466 [Serpula lacrymans var. lacrymans S7.9]EGO30173.1 hypothetical protein SERLADRAFT_404466 [Serpula lacrymans var. lacrymans S7.9]